MYPVKRASRILCALLLGLGMGSVNALSTDKEKPVEIEADSVDINEAEGRSIYKGDVELNQGSMRLLADRVTVFYEGTKPYKLEAVGKPVKFRQLPDNSDIYVEGEGNKVEYKITSEELILTDQAELRQGKNTFRSDRITYDRVKAVMKAGASAGGKQRVKTTFQPRKDQ